MYRSVRARLKSLLFFLLFLEKNPKHRVAETIPVLGLMILSGATFMCGLYGFLILVEYGPLLFTGYFLTILTLTLELLHIAFDR